MRTEITRGKRSAAKPARRRPTWWRVVRWVWFLLSISLTVVMVVMLWRFCRVPSWYRPIHLAPEQIGRVSDELAEASNRFARDLFDDRLITMRFTQRQLCEWLLASDEVEQWLPPELSDPLVVLEADRIITAAIVRRWGMEVVVSIAWRPRLEGDRIGADVLKVAAGSVGVSPGTIVRLYGQGGDLGQRTDADGISLLELMDGQTLPNRFRWPNGHQSFSIESVELAPGVLTVRIQPLH